MENLMEAVGRLTPDAGETRVELFRAVGQCPRYGRTRIYRVVRIFKRPQLHNSVTSKPATRKHNCYATATNNQERRQDWATASLPRAQNSHIALKENPPRRYWLKSTSNVLAGPATRCTASAPADWYFVGITLRAWLMARRCSSVNSLGASTSSSSGSTRTA